MSHLISYSNHGALYIFFTFICYSYFIQGMSDRDIIICPLKLNLTLPLQKTTTFSLNIGLKKSGLPFFHYYVSTLDPINFISKQKKNANVHLIEALRNDPLPAKWSLPYNAPVPTKSAWCLRIFCIRYAGAFIMRVNVSLW